MSTQRTSHLVDPASPATRLMLLAQQISMNVENREALETIATQVAEIALELDRAGR